MKLMSAPRSASVHAALNRCSPCSVITGDPARAVLSRCRLVHLERIAIAESADQGTDVGGGFGGGVGDLDGGDGAFGYVPAPVVWTARPGTRVTPSVPSPGASPGLARRGGGLRWDG